MLAYFDTLQTMNLPIIAFSLIALIVVVLIFWLISLDRRITRLLGGERAKSIEESTKQISGRLSELEKFQVENVRYLRTIETRVKRSFQASETIRFNPFKGNGDGGNQSFATSWLTENGDGVIISSLYSRDRVSIFSKPIQSFKPLYELSDEEKESLAKAAAKIEKN